MNEHEMWAQAIALKETAETMIKSGRASDQVDLVTRAVVQALLAAAKQLRGNNPVIAAIVVGDNIAWSEALMISNAVYKT